VGIVVSSELEDAFAGLFGRSGSASKRRAVLGVNGAPDGGSDGVGGILSGVLKFMKVGSGEGGVDGFLN
jgi:hypothetical protein